MDNGLIMSNYLKQKLLPIIAGFIIIYIACFLKITHQNSIQIFMQRLDNNVYDTYLKLDLNPSIIKEAPIVIIDIDEKSLAQAGRWPWPRNKLADLINKLHQKGVTVMALDMAFPEPELNDIDSILRNPSLKQHYSRIIKPLEELRNDYNHDLKFAQSLAIGDTVLGFALHYEGLYSKGVLSNPLTSFTHKELESLIIPRFSAYLGNIPVLQQAAKSAGFINASTDPDGIVRRTSLVTLYQDKLYPSLALATVQLYLLGDSIKLNFLSAGPINALRYIEVAGKKIFTDGSGQVLIPYRGTARSFNYISASDVLNDLVDSRLLQNKIAFIGTSAIGLNDLKPTPVENLYPGVEIQANIAAGILQNSFVYHPDWFHGLEFVLIVLLGLIYTLILPALRTTTLMFTVLSTCLSIFGIGYLLFSHYHLLLNIALLLLLIISLACLNIIYDLVFETHKRILIEKMFGQYVSADHIKAMLSGNQNYNFTSESKELTVLFADIRNFTTISENLTATELKDLLNKFFTPMTRIIFEHGGTIDKYVGDTLMAFWGAPLDNSQHAQHAFAAAEAMRKHVTQLRAEYEQLKLPIIEIGIGLNTGVMQVGDMGSDYRRTYTVLGDPVNLASRLEALTKFYKVKIIVGEMTYKQVTDYLFLKLDKIRVKGKRQAVDIYTPLSSISDITPELHVEVERYNQALELYYGQYWTPARAQFQQLVREYPQRHFYTIYLERINKFIEQGPGPDWDGCYNRDEK